MSTQSAQSSFSGDLVTQLYYQVLKIRLVEEVIAREYPQREMRSPTHLYIGQEAIAAGVCQYLKREDYLYAYYRSHGWYLAKGGTISGLIHELFGKAEGCSRGFGGSMHLIDLAVGFQGTSAIVASSIPHAVGAAFTSRYRGDNRVTVSAFGDGASEEGLFQESLMFAALRKLPVVFICENNGLATNTYQEERQPPIAIFERAKGCGVISYQVDGNDTLAVSEVARTAIEQARAGGGPSLIECLTYRLLEHCGPNNDIPLGFRKEGEIECWQKRDPLTQLEGKIAPNVVRSMRDSITAEIGDVFLRARQAAFPILLVPEGMR